MKKNESYWCSWLRKTIYYEGQFNNKFEFSDILGDPYLLTAEEVSRLIAEKNKKENKTMKNFESLKIWGVCQDIKGDIDTLYGLIKCNPQLATKKEILDLADGLCTAAEKARLVAYNLGDTELYSSIVTSSTKLVTLTEGV